MSETEDLKKLVNDAQVLLQVAQRAAQKMRLTDRGNDIGLSHEVRMFALHFSPKDETPPPVLSKGSGEFQRVFQGLKEVYRALDQVREEKRR